MCQINEKTRTQCRSCRYNKCIQVGMIPAMVDIKTPKKNGDDDSEEKTRHKGFHSTLKMDSKKEI